ncbi:MAG: DUF790 family protein [Lentisphaeria bacterium]|nr:DUF790 family protein [Lentisphaeria bacterium]
MLKKEHICCKIASGRVKPQLTDTAAPSGLETASSLLAVYNEALTSGMTRSALEQLSGSVISASPDEKLASGLNKLLLDRTEFAPAAELDYPAYRKELFSRSAELFKQGILSSPPSAETPDIYGDLPAFEQVSAFEALAPEALLELYNLAQCQALLIYASHLELRLADPDVSALRKVMKAVKFFRLLAEFSKLKQNGIKISVSGPYALFGPSVKYAISLAALLPVLVNLKKWSLEAVITLRERELKLKLDEKLGLHSAKRSFSSFVPEEIRLYHRHFAEKSADWQIVGDTPFLDAGNQQIIFPDLSFASQESGKVIHLELFHRWHAGQLNSRLELLKQHPELPLILGIDRAIMTKAELDEKLSNFPDIRKRCWLFSEFPGVENTLRVLRQTEC